MINHAINDYKYFHCQNLITGMSFLCFGDKVMKTFLLD